MPECNTSLAGDFASKCGYKPKQGIYEKWLINWADIDFDASQLDNRNTKITDLVLKAGKKIYKARGNDKTHKVKHALVVGDFGNGYTHTDEFSIIYKGENERERIQELVEGARVVTLIKKIDGGEAGELRYEIAGFESGMKITNDDFDSSANSGTTTIICATKEGEEEATGLKLFLPVGGTADIEDFITANEYVPA